MLLIGVRKIRKKWSFSRFEKLKNASALPQITQDYKISPKHNVSTITAWKVSVFGVILVRIFPHLDRIRIRNDRIVRSIANVCYDIQAFTSPLCFWFHDLTFVWGISLSYCAFMLTYRTILHKQSQNFPTMWKLHFLCSVATNNPLANWQNIDKNLREKTFKNLQRNIKSWSSVKRVMCSALSSIWAHLMFLSENESERWKSSTLSMQTWIHTAKKGSFPLRIYSVNVTKYASKCAVPAENKAQETNSTRFRFGQEAIKEVRENVKPLSHPVKVEKGKQLGENDDSVTLSSLPHKSASLTQMPICSLRIWTPSCIFLRMHQKMKTRRWYHDGFEEQGTYQKETILIGK